ncbi:MAG: ECF transporter S component [Clostridia bacterium]|nr:ECF transporter S component [Clostridia bacterium]
MSPRSHISTRRMVALALFAALAYVCTFFLHIKVMFLTFDAKDAFMAVAGMFFGPGAAAILSLLVATLELITMGETGLYGFIMNVISSATFTVIASLIYKHRKTLGGALFSLGTAVVGMTAVMMVMNLLITPHFMGSTVDEVAALIPTLLLPFNLTKALLNAALVLVLYKPIATALRRTRMVEGTPSQMSYRMDRRTITMLLLGVALLLISIVLFLVVLDGRFVLWE